MRHRKRGRHLNRTPSHRKAMFRNMAVSLITSLDWPEGREGKPGVPGRVVTTVEKAKEIRPIVEKLVTMAKKARIHSRAAAEFGTSAERNSPEWKKWRDSDQWQKWAKAMAPAVAFRRRAFSELRDKVALRILFDQVAERFADRPGGYLRVIRLSTFRLGDAGRQAILEFVGDKDRPKKNAAPRAPLAVAEGAAS